MALGAVWIAYCQSERVQFFEEQRNCRQALVNVAAETQRLKQYVGDWDNENRTDAVVDYHAAWDSYDFECKRFIFEDDLTEHRAAVETLGTGALVASAEDYAFALLDGTLEWLDRAAAQVHRDKPMGWLPWQRAEFVYLPYPLGTG